MSKRMVRTFDEGGGGGDGGEEGGSKRVRVVVDDQLESMKNQLAEDILRASQPNEIIFTNRYLMKYPSILTWWPTTSPQGQWFVVTRDHDNSRGNLKIVLYKFDEHEESFNVHLKHQSKYENSVIDMTAMNPFIARDWSEKQKKCFIEITQFICKTFMLAEEPRVLSKNQIRYFVKNPVLFSRELQGLYGHIKQMITGLTISTNDDSKFAITVDLQ